MEFARVASFKVHEYLRLKGRMEPARFDESHVQGMSSNLRLQLRKAHTTAEKIVGSRPSEESNKQRLILLRHAKSSRADRLLKGVCSRHGQSVADRAMFPMFPMKKTCWTLEM